MDTLLFLAGICFVAALLRGMFKANHDPEYIVVPVFIRPRQQRSGGCLFMVLFLLFSLLLLTLLGSGVLTR